MKRIMDIGISLILLILFSPLLLIVGAIVRISLGSPILFTQLRPGLHEKPFKLYKLRTMLDIKDIDGNLLEDELRLTVIGRFIRKTSLDEFPQLFNVMKGDMSLVGPRPLLMEYLSEYTEEQKMRHHVRPGITGWAQVNGRNAISWEEKFKLDTWYVKNQSLLLDIKILFRTLVKVVKSEGISNGKHATMPIFRGNREYEG